MKNIYASTVVACAILVLTPASSMAIPKFGSGTAVPGAIAYQDSTDPTQFHYLPLTMDTLLGGRLKAFSVTHFGIGKSYFVQSSTGEISSRAGAIVSGTINFDLSEDQRNRLVSAISKEFNIENPKLLPVVLRNVKVASTALGDTLSFGEGLEQNLPSNLTLGADQNFSIGTLNSGFGHIAAAQTVGSAVGPNSHFGMNVVADVEFVGEPWTADIKCDLSQVWNQVRTKGSASVSAGWFKLGSATYSKIHQELKDSGACTFHMVEGSLDTAEYGRQVMDMTKTIFEAINASATEGTGFFRFDTRYPQADQISTSSGGGIGLFGFSVSVSGGHSSAHFKQEKLWETTVSYTGNFESPVAFGSTMAVDCGQGSDNLFKDLNDANQPCVTTQKAELLRERLRREGAAKLVKYLELEERLALGSITEDQFSRLKALYDRISLTEFVQGFAEINVVGAEGMDALTTQPAIQIGITDQILSELERQALQ